MKLDGQGEPLGSDPATHAGNGMAHGSATIAWRGSDQAIEEAGDGVVDGARWRGSDYCTERERRSRWPIG